jgi:hypothetical protein
MISIYHLYRYNKITCLTLSPNSQVSLSKEMNATVQDNIQTPPQAAQAFPFAGVADLDNNRSGHGVKDAAAAKTLQMVHSLSTPRTSDQAVPALRLIAEELKKFFGERIV